MVFQGSSSWLSSLLNYEIHLTTRERLPLNSGSLKSSLCALTSLARWVDSAMDRAACLPGPFNSKFTVHISRFQFISLSLVCMTRATGTVRGLRW